MRIIQLAVIAATLATGTVACASSGASLRASGQDTGIEEVFDRVHASVVTIHTVGQTGLMDATGQAATEGGLGSGVLVSEEGHILTAAHVVQIADEVQVEFLDGTMVPAYVLGSVPEGDVALLRLEAAPPTTATVAKLALSDTARVGSRVLVIGAPLGISHTLTVGHISARRRAPSNLGIHEIDVFQTDAAINKGNSGGPLFDMQGEVIGVVSHIVSETGGSQGLGFAITAGTVRKLLIDRGPFWSGMLSVGIGGVFAEALNLPGGRQGLLVQVVAKNSPGEKLGLRGGAIPATIGGQNILLGGDVVLEAFGWSLTDPGNLKKIDKRLGELQPGERMTIRILRGGREMELSKPIEELLPHLAQG